MKQRKTTDLSEYDNSWYKPGNFLKRILWYFINILVMKNGWNPSGGVRRFFLKLFGADIGTGVVIKPGVSIKYPWKLRIGNYVWIGENVWIDNLDQVTFEDHSCISQGAMILCGNHNYKKSSFDLIVKPVKIETGAWIGAMTVVCPGVICKNHAVLTVGSVAVHSLDAFSIYQGNPAKKIKDRNIRS